MFEISWEMISKAMTGELPSEITRQDFREILISAWHDTLEPLSFTGVGIELLEESIEAGAEDSDSWIHDQQRWWAGLRLACESPSRFLFAVPLGNRNYGRGDQDRESIYTVFFHVPQHIVRVTVFAFDPMGYGGDEGAPQEFAVMMSDAPRPWDDEGVKWPYKPAPSRSFTAFHWKFLYVDDARMRRYFETPRLCGAWEKEGYKPEDYDPGPAPGRRDALRETRWDLVQLQGMAVARAALSAGAETMNAERDHVNLVLNSLKTDFGALMLHLAQHYQEALLHEGDK